jgi:hypothetical protein
VVLYAVDLDELREWVGCLDEERFRAAWEVIQEDEDSDWEPEELARLEVLLRRLVFEGKLYDGLADEEKYYLTQLLIDLFDEFGDHEALTEDVPLEPLLKATEAMSRASSEGARLARYLVRGRELNGDAVLWKDGPVADVLSFMGYVTRHEAAALVTALDAFMARPEGKAHRLAKPLRAAAAECAEAELDLVSFVG